MYCKVSRDYIDTLHSMPGAYVSWVPDITIEEGKRRPYRLIVNTGGLTPSYRTGQAEVGDWIYIDRDGRTRTAKLPHTPSNK